MRVELNIKLGDGQHILGLRPLSPPPLSYLYKLCTILRSLCFVFTTYRESVVTKTTDVEFLAEILISVPLSPTNVLQKMSVRMYVVVVLVIVWTQS